MLRRASKLIPCGVIGNIAELDGLGRIYCVFEGAGASEVRGVNKSILRNDVNALGVGNDVPELWVLLFSIHSF